MNGNAKAVENASIVTTGCHTIPEVEFIRTVPTIGPVQENETSTSVRAMKKVPASPPRSALRSVSFTMRLGRVISNAPKNDAANIMNTTKNSMLGIQCVAIQLKMSAVTA